MRIAKVIVDVPVLTINQFFDYLIPEHLKGVIEPGMRVVIPFGPRKITGFVVEVSNESSLDELKPITKALDVTPVLTKELIELGLYMAEDTLSFYITAFQAMLPQVLKSTYEKEVEVIDRGKLSKILQPFFQYQDKVLFDDLIEQNISYHQLRTAIQNKQIKINYLVKSRITKKYVTEVYPEKSKEELILAIDNLPKNAVRQKEILHFFVMNHQPIEQVELMSRLNISSASLQSLCDKGLLGKEKIEIMRTPYVDTTFERTRALPLTDEQSKAIQPILKNIKKEKLDVFLLHGVTGSGKTEIYLQAIEKVIEQGKEAIVLVPEISLTPQMVKRFKGRFGSNVAVLHSALSIGEKYDEWRKVQRKEVQVVVGARSAIFAPFENLGIIIIDEEHETTYKQEESPRYHARDVAIKRGEYNCCPVILGSATPTLESYARGTKDVYHLLTLSKRTNKKAMPKVEIIDMRKELHAGNRTMFSRLLMTKINECLRKNEQIVLLLNRRGYSTFALCRDCGHVEECPHCDISLTYHKRENKLKCHYCAYETLMPTQCPNCQSSLIRFFGTGPERVQEALTKLIPEARVIRMDVDTTRRKGAHERLLKKFANREADILLGTQMIAKGLDFEHVTLVGVLAADSMLHLPDFRSSEKTFQLITQVSGRAGRHELEGEVIVQTYTPEHYSIHLASQYNYGLFYKQEMNIRRTFAYPPYVYLLLLTITHENEQKVFQVAQKIRNKLVKRVQQRTVILGPSPSPIARIKNRYRYQLIIKYRSEPHLAQIVKEVLDDFENERRRDLQIIVDFNPYQLM